MPESIDPKAIYSSTHIATLLGTTEGDVIDAFQASKLRGREIGRVWYCTGKSLLKSLSKIEPSNQEAISLQPSPTPPVSEAKKKPAESKAAKSDGLAGPVPKEPAAKKRYLAKQVESAVKQAGTYETAATQLNEQRVPSLSGDPWTHRSVGNVLRWARRNL